MEVVSECSEPMMQEIISKAMSIHLISNRIFQVLPFQDVLRCSAVSKAWNTSARAHLRGERVCLAAISGHETCKELSRFATRVSRSFNPPYNGLKLSLRKLGAECSSHGEVANLHESFREGFNIKHLKISWITITRCPTERLIQDLILDPSVESVTVTQIPFNVISLIRLFRIPMPQKNNWLPNVRVVSFDCVPNDVIVFELIAASPKVHSINGVILVHHLPFIRHFKKCKAVRDFVCEPKSTDVELVRNFALERPKLRKLTLSSYWWYWPSNSLAGFLENLQLITASSRYSLEEFNSDQLSLIWLSKTGMSFPNVKKLTVRYDQKVDEREGYSSLQKINFNGLFPHLQMIRLWGEHIYIEDATLFPSSLFFRDAETCPPCSAKELKISHARFWGVQSFQIFGTIFSHVKSLFIESSQRVDLYLPLLWKTWPEVESINVDTRDLLAEENLDALFCGMSREEVTEISKQGTEFMTQYQYAPIKHSLICLKRLKSLRLNVSHSQVKCREKSPRPCMLSTATAHLALSRMPKLSMKISRNVCLSPRNYSCGYLMDELKPYVTFLGFRYWSSVQFKC